MWKITFFFTQLGSTWTETFYTTGAQSSATVQQNAISVALTRLACMGPQTQLTAIRIVNTGALRVSYFVPPSLFAQFGTFISVPASDPDQDSSLEFVALQVKFIGQTGQVCRRYMGGWPEGQFGTKFGRLNLNLSGLAYNALLAFSYALFQAAWSFRYTNQASNQLVQALVTAAQFPNEVGIQFGQQMIAPVVGKPIQMHLKGFRKVNVRQFGLAGVYTVDPASPGITASVAPYIYYLQNTSNVQIANISVKGVGAQLAYGFDLFTNPNPNANQAFSVLNARHHKRGASALAFRGRLRSKP